MPHLQINFAVHDLVAGVRFYSAMFARDPAELKPDYATWMIDDPRVSFTIFAHDALPRVIDLSGHKRSAVNQRPPHQYKQHHVDRPLHFARALRRQPLSLADGRSAAES